MLTAASVINMLKAGAHGYLLKDCAFEELAQAIRLVMANKTYLSPGVAEIVVKDYVHQGWSPRPRLSCLLPGNAGLQLMAEGKSTSQIAELLAISVKTVETHRQQIMQNWTFAASPNSPNTPSGKGSPIWKNDFYSPWHGSRASLTPGQILITTGIPVDG